MKIWQSLFKRKSIEPQKKEERYILCLDGGGMRGVISIAVLQQLEKELGSLGADGPLSSHFDMIAGTSTGGLISLVLALKPDTPLEELMNTYMTSGSTIFPQDIASSIFAIKRLIFDKYPAAGIESVLSSWFGDMKMKESSVPVMTVSYDLSIGKETLIRSWAEGDFPAKEAGRATSAAPTYFAPLIKGSSILADGGIIANNPSVYAYFEAKKLYPDCKKFHILSISTAPQNHTMERNQTSGLISWAEDIVPMYSTAQKHFADYVLYNTDEVSYVRIDGQMDQKIQMDDINPQSMEKLRNFGIDLAADYREVLSDFAKQLKEKDL